jgi:hypothetical protein
VPVLPPSTLTTTNGNGGSWNLLGNSANAPLQSWVTAEYLVSWFQGSTLPPLVTTSPAGTPRGMAGAFGPATSTLFGGAVNDDSRTGFRSELGYWFTPSRILGFEAGTMVLESQSTLFSAASNGNPIIARPFIDANTNTSQAVLVAFPGTSTGGVDIRASSGNFYEAHFDFTENFLDKGWVRGNALLGYRFFRYNEGLHIRQTLSPSDPSFALGTQIVAVDDFNTRNEFHGGDLGLRFQFFWESFSLDLLSKVAIGRVHRFVGISGTQTTTVPGSPPLTQNGGVLALSSNIGTHEATDATVLPEFGVNLIWQARPHIRLRAGYSLLLLSEIARPGDQVDITLNPNLFPTAAQSPTGPGRPIFFPERRNFSVQSLSFGVEFTF